MSEQHIQAVGPWVLVRVDKWPEKTAGGLYIPQGNMEERMGMGTGTVVSTGRGKAAKKGSRIVPTGVESGDKVVFRGFLQEANRTGMFDNELCFLHQDDIAGVLCG